jgi:hypothetical protein
MRQERISEMIHDLDSLNDRLSDLALDLLHQAMGDPDPKLSAAAKSEKIVTRSRRSVEKARSLLNSLEVEAEE